MRGQKILALLLALAICLALCPAATAAPAQTPLQSGDLTLDRPTPAQIRAAWQQITSAAEGALFEQAPSVTAPYAAGKLTDDFLNSGLSYLNFVRFLAGLPSVQLDASLNESAQYGAVLLAANHALSHTPPRPADMDEAFYTQGYQATASSNISWRDGYDSATALQGAVAGCMQDVGSVQNLSTVGHRRWLLNPKLRNVGFGYAASEPNESDPFGGDYVTTKVFDRSGSVVDYDFIAWPASGAFPAEQFSAQTPWSITLNPERYQTPDKTQVSVRLTRVADQKSWTFDAGTGAPAAADAPYFVVDTDGYGVANCIIFNPGNEIAAYSGAYTVEVTGLRTVDGTAATVAYTVEFFQMICTAHNWGAWRVTTPATCTTAGERTRVCTICNQADTEEVAPLHHNYIRTGQVASTCQKPGYEISVCSRCQLEKRRSLPLAAHRWGEWKQTQAATATENGERERVCAVCGKVGRQVIPRKESPFVDVTDQNNAYYAPILWAVGEGITTGTSKTTFSPNQVCTRAQFVTFLWRAAGKPAAKKNQSPFTDVADSSQYYYQAVLWAVEAGVTNGVRADQFDPNGTITRAQAVTFFYRYDGEHAVNGANPFTDVPQGQYYTAPVLWAVAQGITNGTGTTTFSPNTGCIRGQMVTFLYRYQMEPLR